MNKEAIELLEKAKESIRASWESKYSGFKEIRDADKYIDQTLKLLKQQPAAGEFTKECQQWINDLSETSSSAYVLFETGKLLARACARLDASESQKKELLEASKNVAAFLKGSHIEKDKQMAKYLYEEIAKPKQ